MTNNESITRQERYGHVLDMKSVTWDAPTAGATPLGCCFGSMCTLQPSAISYAKPHARPRYPVTPRSRHRSGLGRLQLQRSRLASRTGYACAGCATAHVRKTPLLASRCEACITARSVHQVQYNTPGVRTIAAESFPVRSASMHMAQAANVRGMLFSSKQHHKTHRLDPVQIASLSCDGSHEKRCTGRS